jgi:hypothetical protein
MPEGKLVAALRRFCEGEVEFILVGGLAAALSGAPIHTLDIDLVYSPEAENINRLLVILQSMDAVFRIQPERRLRPDRSHLTAGGHLNLLTSFGPLDLLGTIGQNLGFSDLIPHSHELEVGPGVRVRVLNLEMLISMKEQLGSEKDLAMLPILRRTLNESRKREV